MALMDNMRQVKRTAYTHYRNSPIWFWLNPRRVQAYCVGMPKSGTHSMEGLFRRQYRTDHEPESKETVDLIFDIVNGRMSQAGLTQYIRQRDRRLWLELDSSHLNYFFIDVLVREFPQARFILTIRDCYSWMDSFINHQLARPASKNWLELRDYRFGRKTFRHGPGEAALAERGLYTLDGYLSYWAQHNSMILHTVPAKRLLVVRTHEIRQDVARIADFLPIPVSTLDTARSHSFKAKEKFDLLKEVDQALLAEKAAQHCRALMDQFFPEIRDYQDVAKG